MSTMENILSLFDEKKYEDTEKELIYLYEIMQEEELKKRAERLKQIHLRKKKKGENKKQLDWLELKAEVIKFPSVRDLEHLCKLGTFLLETVRNHLDDPNEYTICFLHQLRVSAQKQSELPHDIQELASKFGDAVWGIFFAKAPDNDMLKYFLYKIILLTYCKHAPFKDNEVIISEEKLEEMSDIMDSQIKDFFEHLRGQFNCFLSPFIGYLCQRTKWECKHPKGWLRPPENTLEIDKTNEPSSKEEEAYNEEGIDKEIAQDMVKRIFRGNSKYIGRLTKSLQGPSNTVLSSFLNALEESIQENPPEKILQKLITLRDGIHLIKMRLKEKEL